MEGTTFNLIMGLVSTFSKDPTTLRQEMPILPPIPQQQIVDYLDLKDRCYQTLWVEAQEYWLKNPQRSLDIPVSDEQLINPSSMLGYLINYAKPPLANLERTLEKKVHETIEEAIDETDRATITQFINAGRYSWKKVGPWIKLRLIDGALFSYIDQQQYLKAAEFSYMNMSYHEQALQCHRDLLWLAPQKYTERSKDGVIMAREAEERKKFWQWHERYTTTSRVNYVLHHLNILFHFYNNLFQKAHKSNLLSLAYRFLTSRTLVDDAICELKASHHNLLAETRSKNVFAAMMEHGMNRVGDWFLHKGYFRTPRPFSEVLRSCETLVKQNYEGMKIYQISSTVLSRDEEETFLKDEENSSIEKILPAYIEAIEEDNFFEAKRYSTWYLTKDSHFNWLTEYQDLENYYQELQKIFYYQDLFTDILTETYHTLDDAADEKSRDNYVKLLNIVHVTKEEIYRLHYHRRELKKSFINYIQTKSNLADKGLWERVSNSLSRKAIRYFKEGRISHTVTPYEAQLKELYAQFNHSAQRLEAIKRITLNSFPNNPYFKALSSDGDQVHFIFKPCLLTLDNFAQHFRSVNIEDPRCIRVLHSNAEKNERLFPSQFMWNELRSVLDCYENLWTQMKLKYDQALKISNEFRLFKGQVTKLIVVDSLENQRTKNLLEQFDQTVTTLPEIIDSAKKDLVHSFVHTMESIFNKYTAVDSYRVLGSAGRKVVRVITTGQIINPRKLLGESKTTYQDLLDKWKDDLRKSKLKLDKMIKLLLPPKRGDVSLTDSQNDSSASSSKIGMFIIDDYVANK
ncbi:MAG TPA: hypothetical protein VNJ29_02960 [Candidatus Nitrosotenuis sp.]|nr:hypothetical protein [Candidatus Nitrosotenuis sp.]